jgi:DNA-directed RNA polymerase specialized sigma24 family protein
MQRSSQPKSEEERLVARCLRGEDRAWRTLFRRYHPQLVSIIKCLMHNESGVEQAEEIAAAVWSSLCAEAYIRLREYDPRAGRLTVYLASIARKEIWTGRRSERNRYARECKVARKEATPDESSRGVEIQEFLTTLTRREREFCLSILLKQPRLTTRSGVTSSNQWQIRSRIQKKFRNYFLYDVSDA